jgi:hypothetical protein
VKSSNSDPNRRNLGSQVKNNPIPMILTSIGLSWMMMASGKNGVAQSRYNGEMSSDTDERSLKDALGNTASNTMDKASAAGDRMHDAAGNVKESTKDMRESLVHFYRDQPLLAGTLGIAIGAAQGALVPSTEMEDEMMGETSDQYSCADGLPKWGIPSIEYQLIVD